MRTVASSGGEMTRSDTVVNTTGAWSVSPAVATAIPAGTTTSWSSAADSQKVRSHRATPGGNGSMPTRLRKWTYMRSGTWLSR